MRCFNCGNPAHHQHHVVPRSLGGTATVPLCVACHSTVHESPISHPELTRRGIAAAKERGVVFGGYRARAAALLTPEVRAKAAANAGKSATSRAIAAYADLADQVVALKAAGLTLSAIADSLNASGHTTRTGVKWTKVQVKRLLDRVKK